MTRSSVTIAALVTGATAVGAIALWRKLSTVFERRKRAAIKASMITIYDPGVGHDIQLTPIEYERAQLGCKACGGCKGCGIAPKRTSGTSFNWQTALLSLARSLVPIPIPFKDAHKLEQSSHGL